MTDGFRLCVGLSPGCNHICIDCPFWYKMSDAGPKMRIGPTHLTGCWPQCHRYCDRCHGRWKGWLDCASVWLTIDCNDLAIVFICAIGSCKCSLSDDRLSATELKAEWTFSLGNRRLIYRERFHYTCVEHELILSGTSFRQKNETESHGNHPDRQNTRWLLVFHHWCLHSMACV